MPIDTWYCVMKGLHVTRLNARVRVERAIETLHIATRITGVKV